MGMEQNSSYTLRNVSVPSARFVRRYELHKIQRENCRKTKRVSTHVGKFSLECNNENNVTLREFNCNQKLTKELLTFAIAKAQELGYNKIITTAHIPVEWFRKNLKTPPTKPLIDLFEKEEGLFKKLGFNTSPDNQTLLELKLKPQVIKN